MRKFSLIVAALVACFAGFPAQAQDSALFLCRYGDSSTGVKFDETKIDLLIETKEGSAPVIEVHDPSGALNGASFGGLKGDLSSGYGERDIQLFPEGGDFEGYLLNMMSESPPRIVERAEVLVSFFGPVLSDDPRFGECLMLPGPIAREAFERRRAGSL